MADAVINAAIAKDTASEEPAQKKVGNRKEKSPIHPPEPETIETFPECFEDAANAITHRTAEPRAEITSEMESIPTKALSTRPIEFALSKDNRQHNEGRLKIRSFGLYEKPCR
jgi:hypothetical protein